MYRVLIVDDEKLIVKGLRISLEHDDIEVDCAYDGEEALEAARNNEYDVVLLDVMLPKLNGFEVCQQVREFSTVPIVMLTAKGEDMDKILGLEYGADDYMTKPFSPSELVARVKAHMARYDRLVGSATKTNDIVDITNQSSKEGIRIVIELRRDADVDNFINLLYKKTRTENFGDEVKRRIMMGTFVLSSGYFDAYYRKALKVKAIIKQKFDETFKSCDVILCPVTPTTPQKAGQKQDPVSSYLADIFTVSANIAGLPALSIPCGFHSNGMPIGAQLIGNSLCDKQVLNVGFAYQSEVNS